MIIGPANQVVGRRVHLSRDDERKPLPARPAFPGMDPGLDGPARWLGVHTRLITAIADEIVPKVAPRYYVDVEQNTYLTLLDGTLFSSRPDIVVGRTKFHDPVPGPLEPG